MQADLAALTISDREGDAPVRNKFFACCNKEVACGRICPSTIGCGSDTLSDQMHCRPDVYTVTFLGNKTLQIQKPAMNFD
jgi:hypothetical protein